MANELENKSLLPLHLGASTADGFLLEAAVVKDTTKNQDLQRSLDALFKAIGGGEHGSVASVTANSNSDATVITVTMADGSSTEINLKQYNDAEVRSLITAAQEAANAAQAKANDNASAIEELKTKVGETSVADQISGAVSTAKAEIAAAQKKIDDAQDTKITAAQEKANANEGEINTLKGEETTPGSVKAIAKGYADGAKNAAIEAASADATTKANQALDNAKAYTDTEVAKKVASVGPKDKSIIVDTTSEGASPTTPKVGVQLSATPGILKLEADGLSAIIPAETPYTGADAVVVEGHEISLKLVDDKVLSQNAEGLKTNLGVKITKKEDNKSYIQIVGIGGAVVAEADASAFVVDGMLADASFNPDTHVLTLTLNVDGGSKEITADLSTLVDVYTASKGITKVGSDFQISLDATAGETFLKADEKGLRTEGITDAIATAKGEAISDAEGKIATAKSEAIEAAAADAESKANTALASAKEYTDGKVEHTANYYAADITASGTTIAASTHGCGTNPMVQCFLNNELVEVGVVVDVTGGVTISYNGTVTGLKVVIVGK